GIRVGWKGAVEALQDSLKRARIERQGPVNVGVEAYQREIILVHTGGRVEDGQRGSGQTVSRQLRELDKPGLVQVQRRVSWNGLGTHRGWSTPVGSGIVHLRVSGLDH